MKIKFVRKAEKKKIAEKLNKYGISNLPYLLLKTRKNELRAFSGSLSKQEIKTLNSKINISRIGLYIAEQINNQIMLSFDSLSLLKPKKRIIGINNKKAEKWLKGKDIKIDKDSGYYILKNKDLVGCGKISDKKMSNTLPKVRRKND